MTELHNVMEKLFGEDRFLDEDEVEVISTGSVSLDVSIGKGGVPRGRFTQIWGPEMSGKTTLCLNLAKNALKNGDRVLYIDQESGLDYGYVKFILGDLMNENLIIVQPETAEEAMKIAEFGINGHVERKKVVVEPGQFGLIVLDSIGALAPEEEKEKKIDENTMMITPRLMSKFLRRNVFQLRRTPTAFVFVNQVRARVGSYVGGYEPTGGNALKHYLSLSIMVYKGKQITQKVDGKDEIIGVEIRFTIKKNKLAPPFRSHSFPLIFDKGLDTTRDLVNFADMLGVTRKRGSYYTFEGETIAQGLNKVVLALEEDQELLDKITEMCYNVTGMENKNGKSEDN